MYTQNWRLIAGLVIGALLFAQWSTLGAALLLGGAAYLVFQAGLHAWPGNPMRRQVKETYWRGRRIEMETRNTDRATLERPSLQSVLCLALGISMAVMAVGLLLTGV